MQKTDQEPMTDQLRWRKRNWLRHSDSIFKQAPKLTSQGCRQRWRKNLEKRSGERNIDVRFQLKLV